MTNITKGYFFYIFPYISGSLWLVSTFYKGLDGLDCFDQGNNSRNRSWGRPYGSPRICQKLTPLPCHD